MSFREMMQCNQQLAATAAAERQEANGTLWESLWLTLVANQSPIIKGWFALMAINMLLMLVSA